MAQKVNNRNLKLVIRGLEELDEVEVMEDIEGMDEAEDRKA